MITLIQKWQVLNEQLKRLKVEEMTLRKHICINFCAGKTLPATFTESIGNYDIKIVAGVSRKIDEAVVSQIWPILSQFEKNVFKFKPNLNLSEYSKLDDSSLVHSAITASPSSPVLSIQVKE